MKYSGDVDGSVPTDGTRAWIAELVNNMRLGTVTRWYPWMYTDDVAGDQVGGYLVEYEGKFTFATVHGAGHMVP